MAERPTDEVTLYREEHVSTRQAVARRLRSLAYRVAAGTFVLGDHTVAMPEWVELEIEADQRGDSGLNRFEIELEIGWEE